MREYERYEPVKAPENFVSPRDEISRRRENLSPRPRPKVNKAAVVLGDQWVVFGAFLRVFGRRKR